MTQTQPRKKQLFNMNVDLMHGPILSSLLLFMLPILVSNLFQQLYNTVDTMIVGNVLGDTALAAIGSCGSIYELLVGFGIGIGSGEACSCTDYFKAAHPDTDWESALIHGEKIGLGSREYELVKI